MHCQTIPPTSSIICQSCRRNDLYLRSLLTCEEVHDQMYVDPEAHQMAEAAYAKKRPEAQAASS